MKRSGGVWKRFGKTAAGAAVCLVAGGCTGPLLELPGQGPAPHVYDLSVNGTMTPVGERETTPKLLRLYVAEPVADRALNTDKIVLRVSNVELQTYKNAVWSDRAPSLVQDYLIDSIDKTGAVKLVSGDRTTARGRYAVTSYLRSFEAVYSGSSSPEMVIRLKIVLEDRLGAKILAARLFEARQPAGADRIENIVEAMGRALQQVTGEAVPWILTTFEQAQSATPPAPGNSSAPGEERHGEEGVDVPVSPGPPDKQSGLAPLSPDAEDASVPGDAG